MKKYRFWWLIEGTPVGESSRVGDEGKTGMVFDVEPDQVVFVVVLTGRRFFYRDGLPSQVIEIIQLRYIGHKEGFCKALIFFGVARQKGKVGRSSFTIGLFVHLNTKLGLRSVHLFLQEETPQAFLFTVKAG